MNFRTTYILFALLLASMLAVIIGLIVTGGGTDSDFLLAKFNEDLVGVEDVTSLEIERNTGSEPEVLVFSREEKGGEWKLTKPYAARVDQTIVNDVVRDFMTAKIDTEQEVANKRVSGLAEPTVTVRLSAGDKGSAEVQIGDVITGGADAPVYVVNTATPDEGIAVQRHSIDSLFRQLQPNEVPETPKAVEYVRGVSQFRPLQLLGTDVRQPTEDIERIDLQAGDKKLSLKRESDGTWVIVEPAGYGRAELQGGIDPTNAITDVRRLLNAATAIRVPDHAAFTENPSDLSQFGLADTDKDALRVQIQLKAGGTQTMLLGKPVGEKGERVYAMLKGDTAIAEVPDANAKQLRELVTNPNTIRDKTLVRLSGPNVDAVEIQTGATGVELYRLGGAEEWTLFDSSGEARKGNARAITGLIEGLTQPAQIREFADAKSDAEKGFDKPQAEVRLWVNGVKAPEKEGEKPTKPELKGEPTVTVIFGAKQADLVFVRRTSGKDKVDALVPEALLTLATRGRLEYLDPSLPTFDISKVATLSFDRDGEKYQIQKAKDGPADPSQAKWEILAPEKLKGRFADATVVNRIVNALSALRATKLIEIAPEAKTLERLGLKPDAAKTTVTLALGEGDDAEKRTFLFGDAGEAGAVYAMLGGGDLVFTVDPFVVGPLHPGSIQDMTVLSVPPATVTKLTLTGWQDVVFSPLTLTMEKKNNIWEFAGQEGVPDQETVLQLLGGLSPLKAAEFVALGGEAKPEYKLGVADGALEITLTVEGKPEPVTLTVGGPDPTGGRFYARTNQLPNDVFLIPAGVFQQVKQKPAIFRKG